MKKEAKFDLKTLIPILVLIFVLVGIAFAAITVNSPDMSGNVTLSTGNTVYVETLVNFTLDMPSTAGIEDNATNVTIFLNSSYLAYVIDSNGTSATSTNFTNLTANGFDILIWNISGVGFTNGTSYSFIFNVTPVNYSELIDSDGLIIVHAYNTSGEILANTSSTINVDTLEPQISLLTVNHTNSSTGVNVRLNFSVSDINNDTCILYVGNSTYGDGPTEPDWGVTGQNGTANALDDIGFLYNFTGGNGTYLWNVWCNDTVGHSGFNSSDFIITIDGTPPGFDIFNITNSSTGGFYNTSINTSESSNFVDVTAINHESSNDTTVLQGDTVMVWFNATDTDTGVEQVVLQVYNTTSNDWENSTHYNASVEISGELWVINYTFCNTVDCYQSGRNITFRVHATDFAGNENTTTNLSLQVNDSVKPSVTVTINDLGNFTNISSTTFSLNWSITELNNISYIAWSVDGTAIPSDGVAGTRLAGNYTAATVGDQTTLENYKTQPPGTDLSTIPASGPVLTNGTHYVVVYAADVWGNTEQVNYTFNVDTTVPEDIYLTYSSDSDGSYIHGLVPGLEPINMTNYGWLYINVTKSSSGLSSLQYNTTCNGTLIDVANNTMFQPFNNTPCLSASTGMKTLTVVATAGAGGVNTTTYQVGLDNTVPDVTLNSVNDSVSNVAAASVADYEFQSVSLIFNITTSTEFGYLSNFGYYLDNDTYVDWQTGVIDYNTSYNYSINVSNGGKHTLIIQANDSVGNLANTSTYTFYVVGPVDIENYMVIINETLGGHIARVNITYDNGTIITSQPVVNRSDPYNISIKFELNTTEGTELNVTLANINLSALNWAYTAFSVVSDDGLTKTYAEQNFSTSVLRMVRFNSTVFDNFMGNNDYFGRFNIPFNLSHVGPLDVQGFGNGTTLVVVWFEDESDYTSRTVLSACTDAGATSAYLRTTTTPCYNITDDGTTDIYVPHFSTVVITNDTNASWVDVTSPTANEDTSAFYVNISVAGDVSSCAFKINDSGYYDGSTKNFDSDWTTMTVSGTSPKQCVSGIVALINSTGDGYNLTVNVTDAVGNQNITDYLTFNVTDAVPPTWTNVTNSSIGSTSATIQVESDEYVNASVTYTASNLKAQSSPFSTEKPTVSLSALPSSTAINYTVTLCDRAGNCNTTDVFNFTTSAAEAEAAAAAASAGTSGGGAGVVAATNVVAKQSQVWNIINAGESVTMEISNVNIAFTKLAVGIKNTLTSISLKVASLKDKPSDVTEASSKVYQYLEVTSGIGDSDISSATISFEVSTDWINANKVSKDDIALFRYKDGKWNELSTKMVGSTPYNFKYEATTPGFSNFAIASKVGVAEVKKEAAKPAEEVKPREEVVAPEEAEPIVTPPAGANYVWLIVLVVIVIIVLVYLGMKKKKKK